MNNADEPMRSLHLYSMEYRRRSMPGFSGDDISAFVDAHASGLHLRRNSADD
jgi:hypothetical protein